MIRLKIELAVRFIDLFALLDNAIGDLPDSIKPLLIKKLVNDEVASFEKRLTLAVIEHFGLCRHDIVFIHSCDPILVCILLDISGTMIDISGIFFQLYSLAFQ